jgi:hypothetical protein
MGKAKDLSVPYVCPMYDDMDFFTTVIAKATNNVA